MTTDQEAKRKQNALDDFHSLVNSATWDPDDLKGLRETINSVADYIQSANVEPEWLPIESAPRDCKIRVATTENKFRFDGEYFDCDGHALLPELIVQWGARDVYASHCATWDGKGSHWMLYQFSQDGEYNAYPYVINATHWKPISNKPTPPVQALTKDKEG